MKNINKKKFTGIILAALLVIVVVLVVSLRNRNGSGENEKVVNVGVTNSLGTLNPFNQDYSFINLDATALQFLPLVTINDDYEAENVLAEEITTEDNLTFHIRLKEEAIWSDGTPVTSDDVIFTYLKVASKGVANLNFDFRNIAGFNEDGTSPDGATEAEGLVKIDEKNLVIVYTKPLSLQTFLANEATWLPIAPYHVLKDVPDEELATYDWFNHPDVVDGPYIVDDFDFNHFVSYHANKNYWKGTPKIDRLNIVIVQGSELLAKLQSGEIDIIPPLTGDIPNSDWEKVEALENVSVKYMDAIVNELTRFNTAKVSDPLVRRAFVEAIDRQALVDEMLDGHGEVLDGFVSSKSPFYDAGKDTIPYDPEDARKLLAEAGWDGSQELEYYISSGDTVAVKAAQIIQQQLAEVGITVNLHPVDFATLLAAQDDQTADITSLQYTINPLDYSADESYILDGSAFVNYSNPQINELLDGIPKTVAKEKIVEIYKQIDNIVVHDVPAFPLYFRSNQAAVSNRLTGAVPRAFSTYSDVEQWDIAK